MNSFNTLLMAGLKWNYLVLIRIVLLGTLLSCQENDEGISQDYESCDEVTRYYYDSEGGILADSIFSLRDGSFKLISYNQYSSEWDQEKQDSTFIINKYEIGDHGSVMNSTLISVYDSLSRRIHFFNIKGKFDTLFIVSFRYFNDTNYPSLEHTTKGDSTSLDSICFNQIHANDTLISQWNTYKIQGDSSYLSEQRTSIEWNSNLLAEYSLNQKGDTILKLKQEYDRGAKSICKGFEIGRGRFAKYYDKNDCLFMTRYYSDNIEIVVKNQATEDCIVVETCTSIRESR